MINKIQIALSIFVVLTIILSALNVEYDSTDNQLTEERSGLGLYIDHMTGCHYLSAGLFGGITPRVNPEGDHICYSQ